MVDPRLYSLIKVAETGSFTRAAEQLSLTQSAVSQHIRQLEDQLGVRIFDRSNHQVHVTREGETVLKYARRMMALFHNLSRELSSEKQHISSLTIGITHTAESNPIAEALAKYVSVHSGFKITIVTDAISNLYDRLKTYELDMIIVEGRNNDPALRSLMLDTDCLVLAVSPSHPLAKKSLVTIDELKREKLILRLPDSNTRSQFNASLESQNLSIDDFNVVLEINNIATIKDLIRHDFGVSVLAKSACLDELRKNKIVALPIENLSMVREVNIVYSRDFEHFGLLRDIVHIYNEARGLFKEAP